MRFRLFFLAGAVLGLLLTATVAGQQAAAPQTLVYALNMTGQGGRMGPNGKSMNATVSVAITSTDPDGTRHATLTMQTSPAVPMMGKVSEPAEISPAGAILPKDTKMAQPKAGMTEAESIAFSATAIGSMLSVQLRPFNTFAEECAKQKPLAPGMTWHASTPIGSTPIDTIYTVKNGDRKAGRGVMLIAIQDASTGGSQFKGQGYYDLLDGLVVSMHYEMHSPNQPESEVFDIGLVNS